MTATPETTCKRNCDTLGVCQGLCQAKHPFAPGVIEGPDDLPVVYLDDDGPWQGLTTAETITWFAIVMAVIVLLGMLAGYLVERLA